MLLNYVTAEIKVLEPLLLFARFGVQRDVPKGWNQLAFPQWNQVATSSVSTITEGTNPSNTTWGNTDYTVGVTQYGLLVQVTDILIRNSAIEVVDSCIFQVKNALARKIDNSIQTTVQGGTNGHLYAGGKSARASLASGDVFTVTEYVKAVRNLRQVNNAGLMPFEGNYFVAVIHPNAKNLALLNLFNSVKLLMQKLGQYRAKLSEWIECVTTIREELAIAKI